MLRPELLEELVVYRMPYGKYKDRLLCELPEYYLGWLLKNGRPQGKFGMLIATLYEIKLNGLEYLLEPIKKKFDPK